MILKEIKERVKRIEKMSADDEAAHGEEDTLYSDFVEYVSKTGSDEHKKMARAILKTKEMYFARWCA